MPVGQSAAQWARGSLRSNHLQRCASLRFQGTEPRSPRRTIACANRRDPVSDIGKRSETETPSLSRLQADPIMQTSPQSYRRQFQGLCGLRQEIFRGTLVLLIPSFSEHKNSVVSCQRQYTTNSVAYQTPRVNLRDSADEPAVNPVGASRRICGLGSANHIQPIRTVLLPALRDPRL